MKKNKKNYEFKLQNFLYLHQETYRTPYKIY